MLRFKTDNFREQVLELRRPWRFAPQRPRGFGFDRQQVRVWDRQMGVWDREVRIWDREVGVWDREVGSGTGRWGSGACKRRTASVRHAGALA
jgi:hypothetical protein